MDNKEAAKELFFQGWTQKRIAKALGVTEQTVSAWSNAGYWQKRRTEEALMKETASEGVWAIINHNQAIIQKLMKNELKDSLVGKGEIDALTKLFSVVKNQQTTWSHYVSICRELVDFIGVSDLELSKRMLEPTDEFLNQKRKDLT